LGLSKSIQGLPENKAYSINSLHVLKHLKVMDPYELFHSIFTPIKNSSDGSGNGPYVLYFYRLISYRDASQPYAVT
jgi:hypothetical protein